MSTTDATFEPPKPHGPKPGEPPALGPVAARNRIVLLDGLRGLAVLGILAVNAIAFAWPFEMFLAPEAAPYAPGGLMGPDNATATWVVDVFFKDKMRTLFALLFGVSIFLVGGERSDLARGRLLRRRLLWLGAIGLVHGLGFWFGDILLLYAACGLIVMLMRSWPAGRLLWVGGGVTLALALLQAAGAGVMAHLPADLAAEMNENPFGADTADVLASVAAYQASGIAAWLGNAKAWAIATAFALPTMPFAVVPLMLLGLGLFKSGFLMGRSPTWVYGLFVGLAGINLAVLGYAQSLELAQPVAENPSGGLAGVASALAPLVTIGYASLLILMATKGLGFVVRAFAPVGRMAFTNYLSQTLIMTTLFYMPWGPRWFGEVEPAGLWAIVGAIWVLQLIWSPLWLARFRMGPLEWAWRSLTYGRPMPIRNPANA